MTEAKQITEEYLNDELGKYCSPCELEDFKEWLTEESNWRHYYSGAWINTKTRNLIGTKVLYQKYLDAREIQNQQS